MERRTHHPIIGLFGNDAERSLPYCAICETQTDHVTLIEGRQVCGKVSCQKRARESSESERQERARQNRFAAERVRDRSFSRD